MTDEEPGTPVWPDTVVPSTLVTNLIDWDEWVLLIVTVPEVEASVS